MSQSPDPPPPLEPEPEYNPQSASEEPNVDPQPNPVPMDMAVPETVQPTHNKPTMNRRKKKQSKAYLNYLASGEQKLSILRETLKPVPFSPLSSLADLPKHETLFRALGLWDFANLTLDKDLCSDLIASVIAFYDPAGRKSLVNGARISVSKADLARALSLPVKINKSSNEEADNDIFRTDEAVGILLEFISSYMLFHLQDDDEDACILPQEVAEATQLVKEGQPEKVYWAGLIWGFVEKELIDLPENGVCYYASHLQQLIKYQQPRLLELVPEIEASADVTMEEVEDEEEEEEEEEEEGEDGDEKNESLEEMCITADDDNGEKVGPSLSLGLSGEENNGGFEADQLNWGDTQERGNTELFGHTLRPCGSGGFGFESLSKHDINDDINITEVDEEEGEEEEEQYMRSFQRMDSSTDLLQAMENVNGVSLFNNNNNNNGADLNNQGMMMNSGDFLSMNGENNNANSFFFSDTGKRPLNEIDDDDDNDDDDDDDGEEEDRPAAKRMRSDHETENWSFEQPSSPFHTFMSKAEQLYNEKNQAMITAQMQVQYLTTVIAEKDHVIQHHERSMYEEQRKYTAELSRYEQEMNIMAELISGYKQALKQTRHKFAEYRRKFPEGGERREKRVYYGDVPNGGGLVIGTEERERRRREREVEMRRMALGLAERFQNEWVERFEAIGERLLELESRAYRLNDGIKGCMYEM